MFIVPKEQVRPIDIPPAEVMKFIVSAGVAGWDWKNIFIERLWRTVTQDHTF